MINHVMYFGLNAKQNISHFGNTFYFKSVSLEPLQSVNVTNHYKYTNSLLDDGRFSGYFNISSPVGRRNKEWTVFAI